MSEKKCRICGSEIGEEYIAKVIKHRSFAQKDDPIEVCCPTHYATLKMQNYRAKLREQKMGNATKNKG